jgi:RimJ/RimL family protein N-acetyltransferase
VTVATPEALAGFIHALLAEQASGSAMAYAARNKATGELVGSTAYLHIDHKHRRVEIGSTWWAPQWQRTFVNSTAKRLMIDYAFDVMNAMAIELRTDALNAPSRRAIERLGATYSGCLPAHRICDDGRVRDTVVYTLTRWDQRAT